MKLLILYFFKFNVSYNISSFYKENKRCDGHGVIRGLYNGKLIVVDDNKECPEFILNEDEVTY